MKFYNITQSNLKHLFAPLFAVFLTSIFQAQNITNSPYSRFGIGDLQTIQTPRNVAMGGLSVGLVSVSDLTVKNPASYINLDSLMVNFEVSMYGLYSKLSEKNLDEEIVTANTNSASLGHISFAFPITPWLKSCFGLTPHSNMGYNVFRTQTTDSNNIGSEWLNNQGQGGLNQVFLGFAVGTSRISAGANINYQFGSFVRNAQLLFLDTVLHVPLTTELSKFLEVAGFFVDFGVRYRQPLSNRYQLGFGVTYTPKYSLNATRNQLELSTMREINIIDTIYATNAQKGTLQMPDMYTFGLSFERLNRWVVGAEYSIVNFKNYREYGHAEQNLSNAQMFRLGMELKGRRLNNNFMNRLSYRFGYHYGRSHVDFHDSELTQYGVSFGFGMPVRRSQSRVDFAIEFGRKGNVNSGQIQDNYGRIIIGISAFDRWFMRPKFD